MGIDRAGLLLRDARKRKGLTVSETLRRLGRPYRGEYEQKMYSNLETGKQYPQRNNLKKICELLEVDYEEVAEAFAERLYLHKLNHYLGAKESDGD